MPDWAIQSIVSLVAVLLTAAAVLFVTIKARQPRIFNPKIYRGPWIAEDPTWGTCLYGFVTCGWARTTWITAQGEVSIGESSTPVPFGTAIGLTNEIGGQRHQIRLIRSQDASTEHLLTAEELHARIWLEPAGGDRTLIHDGPIEAGLPVDGGLRP